MTTFGDQLFQFGGVPVGGFSMPLSDPSAHPPLIVDGSNFEGIQAAIDAANPGDTIFVQPGTYEENLTVTKDYITLVAGQIGGYGRPDVTPETGVALVVTGQGFTAIGFRFVSEDSDSVQQLGNGYRYTNCVFDGSSGQAATEANLRLVSSATDDGLTASEGIIEDSMVRGSNGYGIAFDVGANSGGAHVGPTHNTLRNIKFISNVGEDIIAKNTGVGGSYVLQDNLFERLFIGMGTSKNKATHIDIQTNQAANNTGNVFAGCFINDDTINTTAVKAAGTGSSFIGCYALDGIIDGDTLD